MIYLFGTICLLIFPFIFFLCLICWKLHQMIISLKQNCLHLASTETIIQGDIILEKGEDADLFTAEGLEKKETPDKQKTSRKDIIRDLNKRWNTTIPYSIQKGTRKYLNSPDNLLTPHF